MTTRERELSSELTILRSALREKVREWRGHARTNRIDAKDELNPELGRVAAAIHEACAEELALLCRDEGSVIQGHTDTP